MITICLNMSKHVNKYAKYIDALCKKQCYTEACLDECAYIYICIYIHIYIYIIVYGDYTS